MKTLNFAIIFIFIVFISCLSVHIYPGKAIIVNRSFDDSLQDSAMIYGYVLDAAEKKPLWNSSKISIEKTELFTFCDSTGFFLIKLLPGIYNIVCFCPIVTDDTLKLDNIKFLPNEKIEVQFLKKVVVW